MSDEDNTDSVTVTDAIEYLDGHRGQVYIQPNEVFNRLAAFAPFVTPEFCERKSPYFEAIEDDMSEDEALIALSHALVGVQRPAADARGWTNIWPHEQVLTASDASAIVVGAMGEEPSEKTMGGGGFTADARHDEDMETIKRLVPGYTAEADEE